MYLFVEFRERVSVMWKQVFEHGAEATYTLRDFRADDEMSFDIAGIVMW